MQIQSPQGAPPKRTSSSSKSRPKKTVAQLKQEAYDNQHQAQGQQPTFVPQLSLATPKPPPKRKPPPSKQQPQLQDDGSTYISQPSIIYQHSSAPSTSYGQAASVSVQYTTNMKVPASGEILSLPPGSINGLPFTPQPGQRIYVIQSSSKQDSFDSSLSQPVSVMSKTETKPPPKRRRPPPKPKPPKGQLNGRIKLRRDLFVRFIDFDTSVPKFAIIPPVEQAKKIAEKQKERNLRQALFLRLYVNFSDYPVISDLYENLKTN